MKHAQSFIEYALIVAVVSATLIVMGLYVRRAVQGNLKIIEEQVEVKALAPAPVTGVVIE